MKVRQLIRRLMSDLKQQWCKHPGFLHEARDINGFKRICKVCTRCALVTQLSTYLPDEDGGAL